MLVLEPNKVIKNDLCGTEIAGEIRYFCEAEIG